MRKSFNLLRKYINPFLTKTYLYEWDEGSSIKSNSQTSNGPFLNCTSGRWGKQTWHSLWPGNFYTPVLKTSGLMNMQWKMMKMLESLARLDCYLAQARVPFIKTIVMKFPILFSLFWGQWLDISSSKLSFRGTPLWITTEVELLVPWE